jgi:hypothetical protein
MQTIGELIEQVVDVNIKHFNGSALDKEGLMKKIRKIPQAKIAWYRVIQPNQVKRKQIENLMPKMTQVEYLILGAIAKEHGISILDLPSKLRTREVVDARMHSMAIFYTYFFYTFKRIGMLFNRDHSTVIHAVETVNDLIGMDGNYTRSFYNSVEAAKRVAPELFKTHEKHNFHFKQIFNNRRKVAGIREEKESNLLETIEKQRKEIKARLKVEQLTQRVDEQINQYT